MIENKKDNNISLNQKEEKPNKATKKAIDNVIKGKNISKEFKTVSELMDDLNN